MTKMLVVALMLLTLFVSATLMATVPIGKKHKGLTHPGGDKVNCAYCHTKHKIEKKKGQDLDALKKKPSCAGEGCH